MATSLGVRASGLEFKDQLNVETLTDSDFVRIGKHW